MGGDKNYPQDFQQFEIISLLFRELFIELISMNSSRKTKDNQNYRGKTKTFMNHWEETSLISNERYLSLK